MWTKDDIKLAKKTILSNENKINELLKENDELRKIFNNFNDW